MKLKKYYLIKKRLESLQVEGNRLEGALENNISKLKKDFNCSTQEEGESFLKQLEKDKKKLETLIKKKMAMFEKKFGAALNESKPDEESSEPAPF